MEKQRTIEIKDLSIGYLSKGNDKVVAEHITSTIFSGELTCLLGPNGIGKSTLLRTLTAFQPKLSGKIFIQGKEISCYSEKKLATLIGVVLTEKLDIKNMTVRELIGLGRSPYTGFWGKLNQEDENIVDKAISLVKIKDLAKRMIQTLSDGERQKVMIAKALAQETPIILLDEPTAFLDFQSKVEIMQLLHQLSRKTNKTIFLSTHDLELALQIADKIWLMDQKNGIRTGVPEDMALNGSLSDFFVRKGIVFDQDSGLFRIENEYKKEVCLIGHGQEYAMIQKALSRNSIRASQEIKSDVLIEITNEGIVVKKSGKQCCIVGNIEELLEKLK